MDNQNLINITHKYGTPLFTYDYETILARIVELKTQIGQYENCEFLYAAKANHNPHIVKIMVENGFGVDAVSINEAKVGLLVGCPLEKVMYTENNISDAEMDEAHELGILVNFNSIKRLHKFGQKYPGSKICVRFNPNVGAASHSTNITGGPNSKFGIAYQYVEDVKKIAEQYDLKIVGIHQHIGSGWLTLEEPQLALDVILDIAKQIPGLEFVDFGGGFGVPYKPEQSRLDLQTLGAKFKEKMDAFNLEYYGNTEQKIKLRFEPGRYPICEAGKLITEVTNTKTTPEGKTYVGTNTGMNHLIRPALYGSYHGISNLTNPEGPLKTYDIVGNICESADYFAKDRELPETTPGDLLSINNAGAYGTAMSSLYHLRSIPAEVIIYKDGTDKLIKPAQSFEEIVSVYNYK
jgi:diaminopimelate decarboxylase